LPPVGNETQPGTKSVLIGKKRSEVKSGSRVGEATPPPAPDIGRGAGSAQGNDHYPTREGPGEESVSGTRNAQSLVWDKKSLVREGKKGHPLKPGASFPGHPPPKKTRGAHETMTGSRRKKNLE